MKHLIYLQTIGCGHEDVYDLPLTGNGDGNMTPLILRDYGSL